MGGLFFFQKFFIKRLPDQFHRPSFDLRWDRPNLTSWDLDRDQVRRLLGVLESKPTYEDIEAIMAESSLDTCPEVQPHRNQG